MLASSSPGPQPIPAPAKPNAEECIRLETWKEIAAFLRRDVRTAKRWERTRGLPVHRLPGGPKAAVFATSAELQRWREGEGLADSAAEPEPGKWPKLRTVKWLGGVALLAVVAWMISLRPGAEPAESPPRVTPLSSYRGVEWFPAVSPASNLIAFSWNGEHQDNYDLYVRVIDSGNPVRLTVDPEMDIAPAWSPDGRTIAFVRWQLGGPTYRYLTMPALGGAERLVATGRIVPNAIGIPFPFLAWTPDGSRLIVSEPDAAPGPYALRLVSLATGEVRQLTEPPRDSPGDCCPVVSPDGRMIAFLRASDGRLRRPHILEIARDGEPVGVPRSLEGPACVNPFWTGDSTEVWCVAGDSVDRRVWRRPVARGGRAREAWPYMGLLGQHFSARGGTLVYSSYAWEEDIWERRNGNGGCRRIGTLAGDNSAPDVSPDGSRIAFVSKRSGRLAVWIADREGANAVELTATAAANTPRWSPRGDSIAYVCRFGDSPEQICTLDVNNRQSRRLTHRHARHLLPSWSRDGRSIYYASDSSGAFEIWKAPVSDSAEPIRVTTGGGYGAMESVDGESLFFTRTPLSGLIYRVPVRGGSEVPLGGGVRSLRLPMNFAVGPRAVYHAWSENPTQWFEIRAFSLEDGKIRTLQRIERGLGNGMTLAPAGEDFLFTTTEIRSGDLFRIDRLR